MPGGSELGRFSPDRSPSKETEGSPKLDETEGLLDEICVQRGHKVVVFSEWEQMQAMAAKVCARLKLGHVCLNGGIPSERRGPLIERFRSDPSCQVFLSTDAGGVGLGLQAASYLINLDLPWNPAVLNQRIGSVHRLGQPNTVNVVLLVSQGGLEERMQITLLVAAVYGHLLPAGLLREGDAHALARDLVARVREIMAPCSSGVGGTCQSTHLSCP